MRCYLFWVLAWSLFLWALALIVLLYLVHMQIVFLNPPKVVQSGIPYYNKPVPGPIDGTKAEVNSFGWFVYASDLLLTLPGTPFLYYGEEIGMPSGPGNSDENKRTPMRWDDMANAGFSSGSPWYKFSTDDNAVTVKAQRAIPGSLYNHYKNLIRIRQSQPALRAGGYEPIQAGERIMAFARTLEDSTIIVVINLDSDPGRAVMDLSGFARGGVRELTLDKTLEPITDANATKYTLKLGKAGIVILELGR